MNKQQEALKLALEGLEKWHFDKDPRGADQYITAIREALAEQPAPVQQEPVSKKHEPTIDLDKYAGTYGGYTITQTGVGIGKPEQEPVAWKCECGANLYIGADGEPRSKSQQLGPVTWGVDWGKAGDIPCVSIIKRLPNGEIEVVAVEYAPYSYTSPPASKPWVGLTDEQIAEIAATPCAVAGSYVHTFARAIEAKLREKNT